MRARTRSLLGCSLSFFCATAVLFALPGCGGDDDDDDGTRPRRDSGPDEDGGSDEQDFPEFDANGIRPIDVDAGKVEPGDPPEQLEGSSCAVDTNKLYDLATTTKPPTPARLAIDLIASDFAFAYVGESDACSDAVYMTELTGGSGVGKPDTSLVSDQCTTVSSASIAHNGDHWLVAIVDTRADTPDLWLQPYDGEGSYPAVRLTETTGVESESAIAIIRDKEDPADVNGIPTRAMIAWIETDTAGGMRSLIVRPLDLDGSPSGDAVVLEQSNTLTFSGLTLRQLGPLFMGLGYLRQDPMAGTSEIVLDVLELDSGERNREPWVLSAEAGAFGSVDLGTDENGGAVLYTVSQAETRQLFFLQLDPTGQPAKLVSGGMTGGPVDPIRVVGPPLKALDASIAKLPNGFGIAYRVLPGGIVTEPRIRLHYLDRFGRDIFDSDLALGAEFGGRTAVGAGYDGRVVVGWSDTDEEGNTTLTAVKVPCI